MKKRRRRTRPQVRGTRPSRTAPQAESALTTSAVFLAAFLDEVARYCRATSQELNAMTDGRVMPRETLLRLSSLGQHYLSTLAALPTRFASDLTAPGRGARSRRRRQGRIVD